MKSALEKLEDQLELDPCEANVAVYIIAMRILREEIATIREEINNSIKTYVLAEQKNTGITIFKAADIYEILNKAHNRAIMKEFTS